MTRTLILFSLCLSSSSLYYASGKTFLNMGRSCKDIAESVKQCIKETACYQEGNTIKECIKMDKGECQVKYGVLWGLQLTNTNMMNPKLISSPSLHLEHDSH
jgi:hypothetical protein